VRRTELAHAAFELERDVAACILVAGREVAPAHPFELAPRELLARAEQMLILPSSESLVAYKVNDSLLPARHVTARLR
jgi:hypothetical protein